MSQKDDFKKNLKSLDLSQNRAFNVPHPILELAKVFSSNYLLGPPVSEKSVRLIAHLFSPEEAEVARHLPFYRSASLEKIAKKAGKTQEEVKPLLESMAQKRVILKNRGGYALIPLIPGIFEYSLWRGEDTEWHRQFAYLINDLFATGFSRKYNEKGKVPALRTIPVQSVIPARNKLVDQALISEMIDRHTEFAVLNVCQCRQSMRFTGKECKRSRPEDGCLVFGEFAVGLVARGDARRVSQAEMREIVKDRWDKKLLFWAVNVQPENPNAICTCCECCCHMLESINHYGGKANLSPPRFLAEFDERICDHCGKCVKACNTYAHILKDKKHLYDPSKCLGCGLCIESCEKGALKLIENPSYQAPFAGYRSLGLKLIALMTWNNLKAKFLGSKA